MRLYAFSEPYCLFISQVFSFFEVAFFFRYHNICIVWLDVIGQKIDLYQTWKIALFWLICSKKQIIGSLCFHPLQDRRRKTNPRYCPYNLKGPKHDQVEGEFFYIKQTRMVRWLRDWQKKIILFMIGANIRHFVFLANAEHTLKIM